MENIIDILKGLEIEVPTEKAETLNKKVSENYKTVAEFDKKVEKMQKDIDKANERATESEETLKGFEGKDFESITKERDEWKVKYETKIREDAEAKEKAEFDEAIENAIKEAKGKNAKSILANLDIESLKASKNRDKDIADAIRNLAESDDTAFLFETDPESKRASFTSKMGNSGSGKSLTKADIMAVQDRAERRKLIHENMDLFENSAE